jgi:Mitochondrial glycoprotein
MQDLPAKPPSPWTLTESPGDSQLLLTRKYNDETIEVRVVADEVRCCDFIGDEITT